MTSRPHALLVEAIETIQTARDELFISHEVDGVIDDIDITLEVKRFDDWLQSAREVVA